MSLCFSHLSLYTFKNQQDIAKSTYIPTQDIELVDSACFVSISIKISSDEFVFL